MYKCKYRHPTQRLCIQALLSEHQKAQDTLHPNEHSTSIPLFEGRQPTQKEAVYIYTFTSSVTYSSPDTASIWLIFTCSIWCFWLSTWQIQLEMQHLCPLALTAQSLYTIWLLYTMTDKPSSFHSWRVLTCPIRFFECLNNPTGSMRTCKILFFNSVYSMLI